MVSQLLAHAPFFALSYAIVFLGSTLAAGTRVRRVFAALIACPALVLPFVAPPGALLRFFLAVGASLMLARVIELARYPGVVELRLRLWHTVGVIDVLRARRVPSHVNRGAALRAIGFALLSAVSFFAVAATAEIDNEVMRYAGRWTAGAVLAYSGFDMMASSLVFLYGLAGVVAPPLHRDPILSKSVAEFWGQRWNRIVHRHLKLFVFVPMVRRGLSSSAAGAAFLASAILHFYIAAPSVGLRLAVLMALFFIVQYGLMLLERRLNVTRWPGSWARVWTVGSILLTAPIFIESALRVLGL
jgi:hypothetical protein